MDWYGLDRLAGYIVGYSIGIPKALWKIARIFFSELYGWIFHRPKMLARMRVEMAERERRDRILNPHKYVGR